MTTVNEPSPAKSRAFEVWRLDDNSNEFLVDAFGNREQAEKKIAELAVGGHRQIYWVKEITA